jgi:glycosyltransferase involved in cell wall biosynthesis
MIDFGVYGERFREEGIEVHRLEMSRGLPSYSGFKKLWSLIRTTKPDVVQTWMYHSDLIGGAIARLGGYRNVVWGIVNFNLDPNVASRSTRWTAKLCAYLSGIIPARIISCSKRAVTAHQQIGYAKKKFVTIPLGYDLAELYRDQVAADKLKELWKIPADAVLIGCVARWDRQKDHQNLLNAFAIICEQFPKIYCVLAGPQMDKQNTELESMIKKINGENERIILAGRVDSIPNTMSVLDLHILPSLGEAFPNVVAEAMACETPCIVTDVGDAAIIVDNTGWVVQPGNTQALAKAIALALGEMENKESWKKRRIECRNRIYENYSMQRMIGSYYNLWAMVAYKKNKLYRNE